MNDAKSPQDCSTMAEVREGIDTLDRQLVDLLTLRASFY